MFPIRDLNPTRIVPVITFLLIGGGLGAFFFWQDQSTDQTQIEFLYEHAVVACEITTGEPLTEDEIVRDVCKDDGGSEGALFPDKNIWLAVIASLFLHGGLFHVLSNMWFLWIFGNNVEEGFGALGYLVMYFAAGVVATGAFVFLNPDETVPLVGASGAIAGLLGAYLVLFPTHKVLTWMFIVFFVPIRAVLFLGFWFIAQFGIRDTGVAWEAHVAGFLFGVLVTLPLRNRVLERIKTLHRSTPERFLRSR